MGSNQEKNGGRKSRDTLPLKSKNEEKLKNIFAWTRSKTNLPILRTKKKLLTIFNLEERKSFGVCSLEKKEGI